MFETMITRICFSQKTRSGKPNHQKIHFDGATTVEVIRRQQFESLEGGDFGMCRNRDPMMSKTCRIFAYDKLTVFSVPK